LAEALATGRLYAHRHLLALVEPTRTHLDAVHDELGPTVVRVDDLAAALTTQHRSRITDLATRLGAGGRAVEDHLDVDPFRRLDRAVPAPHDGQDPGRRGELPVAHELDGGKLGTEALVDGSRLGAVGETEARSRACPLALRLHLDLGRR